MRVFESLNKLRDKIVYQTDSPEELLGWLESIENELKRLENQDNVIENCIRCLESGLVNDALTMLYALRDRGRKC